MNRKFRFLTAVWLLALLTSAAALAGTEKKDPKEEEQQADSSKSDLVGLPVPAHSGGYISIGAEFENLSGSMDRVGEYEAVRQGTRPTGRLGTWGYSDGIAWDVEGHFGVDATDQDYRGTFDFKRYWKSEFELKKLPHRLIKDPLTNLDAAKGGPMVQHTNEDLGIKYCLEYQDANWRNRVTIPGMPLLSLHFDYRSILRKGTYQARAVNHCSTCHVVSKVRDMDRETEEFRTGFEYGNNTAKIEYEFLNRDFQERAQTPTQIYDEVQHPVNLSRVFTNRAQFEGGPLPFNYVPRFKRNRHLVRARINGEEAGEFVATYVNDRSDNSSLGYQVKTHVAGGSYSTKAGNRFRFNASLRSQNMQSDEILVDVNERAADFGPQLGKTYSEIYTDFGPADFLQHSNLVQDITRAKLDSRILTSRHSLIRLGYEFEQLSRPYGEVEKTRTNRFTAAFNSRPSKAIKARARYRFSAADTPFVHTHAALTPALQPEPSPGDSPLTGLQYFTIYDQRQVNLTNFFKHAHELTAATTWAPNERMAITVDLRVKDYSNDEVNNLYTWSDTTVAPSAEIWVAPTERFDFMASYTLHHRITDALYTIAVYDG